MTTVVRTRLLAFDAPLPDGTDRSALLGGKAAGLAVMARDLGLPVPPGFVASTETCREFLAAGWPADLDDELRAMVAWLGERAGREFGNPANPLLVSVRSGAPVSMPGMMDTLLNVGMTPAIRERLAAESGDAVFAADTWLRFNKMYAEIVLEAEREHTARAAAHDGTASGILAAAERVRALAAPLGGIPDEPFEQLRGAICTVFASWECDRARTFRAKEGIPANLGTAATVQAMVFGNLDDRSGTGVAFTRDPSTGDAKPTGDYLARAQGEDVVAGTHRVSGLEALRQQLPAVHAELLTTMDRLERHYRDMCDIEFTVSAGKLYLLQTRIGRRSPLAAVRIAVDMAEDPSFPVSRAEAAARVTEDTLAEIAKLGRVREGASPLAAGLPASPGVGAGIICFDADRAAELAAEGKTVVLGRPETSPSDIHGMAASVGLVTTLGGIMSHAAVVARGWAIPAVCSLEESAFEPSGLRVGATLLAEGDVVTVCGSRGHLYLGDQREEGAHDLPELRLLREWSSGEETPGPVTARAAAEVTVFEVMRVLSLKGLCTAERAAGILNCEEARVNRALEEMAHLLKPTARGMALTAEGRTWVAEQLTLERGTIDAAGLERPFADFLPLNRDFKVIITSAQQAGITSSDHAEWPALLGKMRELDDAFRPIVAACGAVAPRLAAYGPRFEAAMAAFAAGDHSMLASPLKDSYHTVWFEYHEELIALTGRDRATEEAAGH